jgi:hypothetical protein
VHSISSSTTSRTGSTQSAPTVCSSLHVGGSLCERVQTAQLKLACALVINSCAHAMQLASTVSHIHLYNMRTLAVVYQHSQQAGNRAATNSAAAARKYSGVSIPFSPGGRRGSLVTQTLTPPLSDRRGSRSGGRGHSLKSDLG